MINVLSIGEYVSDKRSFLQIAYKIAREQFPNRLRETFLVLTDNPRPDLPIEARRLSLDPRDRREAGKKHRRESDSMSVGSVSNSKKPDQSRSSEKRK